MLVRFNFRLEEDNKLDKNLVLNVTGAAWSELTLNHVWETQNNRYGRKWGRVLNRVASGPKIYFDTVNRHQFNKLAIEF